MYGKSISKQDLVNAYMQQEHILDVVVVCAGGGSFLSEVRTCVGKKSDSDHKAGDGITCIMQVEEEGNCDDEIKLTKFYSDDDFENNLSWEVGLAES